MSWKLDIKGMLIKYRPNIDLSACQFKDNKLVAKRAFNKACTMKKPILIDDCKQLINMNIINSWIQNSST